MSERSVFLAALEISDPAERAAYLDRACAADPSLRQAVEQLLAAHDRSGSFMARPAAGEATTDHAPITEGPGSVLGPYKLMEQIGEGGFGLVFVAEQQQPVRRKVALKILKPGMDTRDVIARFEAERQALALMDHPNIARVFDGGTTAGGRPYFVMELVKGIPIIDYCDQQQLTAPSAWSCFSPSARRCSTPTPRASSTATSSLPTSSWPRTTACPWSRSSTLALPRPSASS
jgi:serine/threonine protein kinase